jgi:hypothetical protein
MRLGRMTVILATGIAGLLIHGMHASKLGLYWDDSDQFMQPLQWAGVNTKRFILSDTCGYFHAERPVAHFLMMIHRAAFAASASALHWSLVLLLILNAVILGNIASKIVDENWYAFAVGTTFLTYPLAPLQSVWAAEAPHLWACLLALLTILFSWYGLRVAELQRLRWFALAALTYSACILTHEVFALIPPAFVSLFILSKDGRNTAEWYDFGWIYFYKPAIWWLGLLVGILGVHGLWRILILPLYGTLAYQNSELVLNPIALAKKVLAGIQIVFVPWMPALERINESPPPSAYVFLSGILFVSTWIITLLLLWRSPAGNRIDHGKVAKNPAGDNWARAAMIGVALIIAAVVAIGVSPVHINVEFGANAITPEPRVNFATTIGIALALPALLALLVQLCRRYMRLVQCYPRYMSISGIVSLVYLLYVGFIGFPAYGNIFTHYSTVPILFGRYSLSYGLIVMAYAFVIVLVGGTIVLSSIAALHHTIGAYIANWIESVVPKVRAHCLSLIVACIVLIGTLFHLSVKEELADDWQRHKAMLEQLHSIAPVVKDDTFVIIVQDHSTRPQGAPYMTHTELSCYLLALYDNWSIMGTTNRHLRFYPDGVEVRYYNNIAMWLPPGIKGPVNLYAPLPVPRISYDRILLYMFDGTTVRMLPEMEVDIEGDGRRVVRNNPERILNQIPVRTAIWQHVME